MKSLFNSTENQEIIERIGKLTHSSQSLWGKMNVSQMLAHCTISLKIAFGEIKPKSNIFLKLMGKVFKKKIFAQEQFRKNSPTGKEFIITDKKDFDKEKPALISYVRRFLDSGSESLAKEPHGFFGKLTVEEWDMLMWKHLDHHLRQFGV
jgi:hypothetical protein